MFEVMVKLTRDLKYPQHSAPINHRARQITTSDFTKFMYILAADGNNLRHLKNLEQRLREQESSTVTAEVKLWGSYLPDNKPITDPYYDSDVSLSSVWCYCRYIYAMVSDSAGWL
jgi:low molecular weight phosphotyrosine protein phosphatase